MELLPSPISSSSSLSFPFQWSTDVLLSVLLLLASGAFYGLWRAFESIWWRQRRIRRAFESQGIPCLPAPFLYGNLRELVQIGTETRKLPMPQITHNISPRLLPHLHTWKKRYGKRFVYWNGSQPRFLLSHPHQAKEVLSTKFGHYSKPIGRPDAKDLIGDGLVGLEGEKWAQHRRVLNPAFFHEKLKVMIPTMASCTTAMMEQWKGQIAQGHDINVHTEFQNLTADIIARTAFGSSYLEGKQVFEMQRQQQVLMNKTFTTVYIPGMRFIPTAFNRARWKLNRNINRILTKLIEDRLHSAAKMGHGADSYGTDLLGLMMASNQGEMKGNQKNLSRMGIPDIIGECKTFFFAGHETTSTLLTWAFLLLGKHTEWQDRARDEVVSLCGKNTTDSVPTIEAVNQMKILTMVLNETLRLYSPAIAMLRRVENEMRLGGDNEMGDDVVIPAGTELLMPVLMWHHEAEYWGPDADEFRPDRFEGGVGKACRVSGSFLPFSAGPRVCIGQGFAMLEAKIVLATILRRFSFRVSPSYRHAPITMVTMQPQFGLQLRFSPLVDPAAP